MLVSTTVIEVGVDVPNATLMVIEHAERFGLAQLHQLRGRVGRGTASTCVLLSRRRVGERARLRALSRPPTASRSPRPGPAIRGPGEFLGTRQPACRRLHFADLVRDIELIEQARDAADELLRTDPAAAQRHLDRWLGGREEYVKA